MKASKGAAARIATHEPAAGVAVRPFAEGSQPAAAGLSNSPRALAQRRRLGAAFGAAMGPEAAEPLQLISEPAARDKLGVAVGEDEVVAMLIELHRAMDAIPALEATLGSYAAFLERFPARRLTRHEPLPARPDVRYQMDGAVAFLTRSLPTLIDVLGEIEDWYLGVSPQERGPQALNRIGEVRQLADGLANGDPIRSLLQSRPGTMAELRDHAGRLQLSALRQELAGWFEGGEGGFSAVGRATDIGTDIRPVDPEALDLPDSDDAFIGGYYRGGGDRHTPESLADSHTVDKARHAPAGGGPLMVAGARVDPGAVAAQQREQLLQQTEAGMPPLIAGGAQRETLRAPPAPRDRGRGQIAGMNRTNANGYAWLTGTPGWDQRPWEWLHIRAASLGGATDGTNLVLGTRDANTLMMPFEANVRLLAGIVRDHPDLEGLEVEWWVEDGGGHRHATLQIVWNIEPTNDAPEALHDLADEASGRIEVANLYTDTHLSKDEVRLIEDSLSTFRQTLRPAEND